MQIIVAKKWDASRFKEKNRGGEATIYDLKPGLIAKIFHRPEAREFQGKPELIEAARVRLQDMQTKLHDLSKIASKFPPEVVMPNGILVDSHMMVFGYTMPFIEGQPLADLCKTGCRLQPKALGQIIAKIHDLVSAVHAAGGVITDFNENNVIITDDSIPHLIDIDSIQFGKYQGRSFMPHFCDPNILKIERSEPPPPRRGHRGKEAPLPPAIFSLAAPHDEKTDWYAFLVIAMRMLAKTGPYGGVCEGLDLAERIIQRKTVMERDVIYPANAVPLQHIPRPALELFYRCFKKNQRFIPDREIFAKLTNDPPPPLPKRFIKMYW